MRKNLMLMLMAFAAVLFYSGFLYAEDAPNKFSHWLKVEKSDAQEIISDITLPMWPERKKITGDDGIEYQLFDFGQDFFFLEDEGRPRLPVRYVWFQIPEDAQDINVEVLESETKLKENVIVYPAPHRYFEENEEGFPIEKEQFTKDEKLYSENAFYPEKRAQIVELAFLRQLRMARVAIYPMLFNPQKKEIKQVIYLKIRITYTSNKEANEIAVDTKDPSHKIYQNILPNYSYEAISQTTNLGSQKKGELDEVEGDLILLNQEDIINPNPTFTIDYLIISADLFYNNGILSPNLQELALHRTLAPYNVGVVSAVDIYEQYSGYPVETGGMVAIKDFIQFVYDNWRTNPQIPDLDFILLVGDADYGFSQDDWFLPLWRSNEPPEWGTPEQNIWEGTASDNDSACVVGTDTIPDLMIGRFPVKNETELNNMVSKTLYFATHPLQGQNHWGTRNLYLAGSNQGNPGFSPPTNLTSNMLISHHQEAEEYNQNDPDPYWQWNSDKITDYLDTEGALILTYNGHGSIEQTNPLLFVSELNNVNQQPAVFFSFSCDNGAFDHNVVNCNAENWTKAYSNKGAVAFFGSSRLANGASWSYSDDTLNSIYDDENYLLGSIIQQTKINMGPTTGTASYHPNNERKRYNLLGDPALDFSNHIGESTKPEFSTILSLSNPIPSPGEEIDINIQIQNVGLNPGQNILVRLFEEINGQLVQIGNDQTINVLEGGNIVTLQQQWTYSGQFFVHFVLQVDPENQIDELSDYNNHSQEDLYLCLIPIYVDDSNTGIENGTLEHPFNTIPEALDYAEANRTGEEIIPIHVMEGIYEVVGNVTIPAYTHLKGLGDVENIIIRNSLTCNSSSVTIENFTIDLNNSGNSNYLYYGNIIGNIFRNCMNGAYTKGALFKNNIFNDNTVRAIFVYDIDNTSPSVYFTNNTIINNNITFTSLGQPYIYLRNNIIRGGATQLYGQQIDANYNNSDSTYILNAGQNNINADPLFVNPATHDFTLLPNSPCIDTGDPNPIYNDPDGSRNDMGAYGGPNAVIPEPHVTITYPQENQVVPNQAPTITWNTSGLGPSESLILEISHVQSLPKPYSSLKSVYQRCLAMIVDFFDVEPAYAEGIKVMTGPVIDLQVTVPNTGTYTVPPDILYPNINYTLELFFESDPSIQDIVHFQIAGGT